MSFTWPWVLWGLALVPALLILYILAQRRRRVYALRFTNLALLGQVAGRGPGARRHIPPLLYLLGLVALVVGLAQPTAVVALPRDQTTVMLVLDVSGSMSANDVAPTRLDAARQAARAFLETIPSSAQVGLVSFSGAASVAAPPSRDTEQVVRAIDGLIAGGGTAVGEGLHLALDQLAARPTTAAGRAPGMVVLLSDGESSEGRSPAEAAARAASDGVVVHTVGLGVRGGAAIIGGGQVVGLDEATLQGIAERTGGQYFYARESTDLARIYADLGSFIGLVQERVELSPVAIGLGVLLLVAGGLLGLRWLQRLP